MKDLSLDTLLKIKEKIAPDIPDAVINKCYQIEKDNLFEKDQERPLEMLKEIVTQFVENEINEKIRKP